METTDKWQSDRKRRWLCQFLVRKLTNYMPEMDSGLFWLRWVNTQHNSREKPDVKAIVTD
jgi:hypothetical protein